jgi:hypothetical protein
MPQQALGASERPPSMTETVVSMTAQIGHRYRATFSFRAPQLRVEWEPDVPPNHSLSAREIGDYRRARDRFLAQVAGVIGGNVACIDV